MEKRELNMEYSYVSLSDVDNMIKNNEHVERFDLSKNLNGKALELYTKQMSRNVIEVDIDDIRMLCKSISLFKTSDDVECLRTDLANDLQILADSGIWFGGTLCCTLTKLPIKDSVQKYLAAATIGIHPSIKSTLVCPGVGVCNEDGVLTRWGMIKSECPNLRCEAFDA